MKKTISLLLTLLTIVQTSIQADDEYSYDTILNAAPLSRGDRNLKRCRAQLNFDAIAKAKVRKCKEFKHLQFYLGEVEASFGFYSNPCYDEIALFSLAYVQTLFDWEHNPFFHQTHFHNLSTKFSITTRRVANWLWIAKLCANFDTDHFNDLNDYVNFDFIAWGRYAYCENLGVHIGFLGYTGMKIDRVYPIVGVDWRCNARWKFNAIFPINISVIYNFNPRWSVALASRVFDVRYRVGDHANLSKGLWAYRTAGAELALNYDCGSWVDFNVHIGTTFGGRFKISNRHNNHGRHFRLDPAGYVGAQANARF